MSDSTLSRLRMPAEWQPQQGTWLSWPHNRETWPHNLEAAQQEFADLVDSIIDHQPAFILCGGQERQARNGLPQHINVELVPIPTDDAWARDYAPTFVVDENRGELVAIDWHYNAWGEKYPPFDQDQRVSQRIADRLGLRRVEPNLVFEGGGIEINDDGLLLSTLSCVLNANRNPHLTRVDAEAVFAKTLGASRTVWLPGDAIEGDDTDGHIDQLARFVNNRTVVYAWSEDLATQPLDALANNREQLELQLAELAPGVECVALHLAPPIRSGDRQVPTSYCNFLFTNEKVLVPQFGNAEFDQHAVAVLGELIPDRAVIGLSSVELSVGLGSFHCLSQQQPA